MNKQTISPHSFSEKISDWLYSCRIGDRRWYVGLILSVGVSIVLPIIIFLFKQL